MSSSNISKFEVSNLNGTRFQILIGRLEYGLNGDGPCRTRIKTKSPTTTIAWPPIRTGAYAGSNMDGKPSTSFRGCLLFKLSLGSLGSSVSPVYDSRMLASKETSRLVKIAVCQGAFQCPHIYWYGRCDGQL
jgi:hypothetical protein